MPHFLHCTLVRYCYFFPRSKSEGSFVRKTQLGEVGGKVWQGAVSNRLLSQLGTVNFLCQALKYVGMQCQGKVLKDRLCSRPCQMRKDWHSPRTCAEQWAVKVGLSHTALFQTASRSSCRQVQPSRSTAI